MKEQERLTEYNVYIDESGDEGLKKGSKYFILTALIIEKSIDMQVAKCVDELKTELGIKQEVQLHWNKIKSKRKKNRIISKICEQDIIIVNVIIDTENIEYMTTKNMYYHFATYLFGKICGVMRERNGIANIIISTRGQLKKDYLISYLQMHDKKNKINEKHIKLSKNKIKLVPNKERNLLQLTDCCCSSLGQSLRFNSMEFCDTYRPLIEKCYSYSGTHHKHGFIFVPADNIPNDFLLIKEILHIKRSKKRRKHKRFIKAEKTKENNKKEKIMQK